MGAGRSGLRAIRVRVDIDDTAPELLVEPVNVGRIVVEPRVVRNPLIGLPSPVPHVLDLSVCETAEVDVPEIAILHLTNCPVGPPPGVRVPWELACQGVILQHQVL